MSEPPSVASACLTILATIRTLIQQINSIDNAGRNINSFLSELQALCQCIELLRGSREVSSFSSSHRQALLNILHDCNCTLQEAAMTTGLGGQVSLRRRVLWSFIGEAEVARLRRSLQTYMSIIKITLELGALSNFSSRNGDQSSTSALNVSGTHPPEASARISALTSEITTLRLQVQQLQNRDRAITLDRFMTENESVSASVADMIEGTLSDGVRTLDLSTQRAQSRSCSVATTSESTTIIGDDQVYLNSSTEFPATSRYDTHRLMNSGWSLQASLEACGDCEGVADEVHLLASQAGHSYDHNTWIETREAADSTSWKLDQVVKLKKAGWSSSDALQACKAANWTSWKLDQVVKLKKTGGSSLEALKACQAANWTSAKLDQYIRQKKAGWTSSEALQACEAAHWTSWKLDQVVKLKKKAGGSSLEALEACKVADWASWKLDQFIRLKKTGGSSLEALQVCKAAKWTL